MRQWTTVDKTGWGDGPWNDEPDKAQWIDEATGFDCLIHRGPLGALCGYVGLPPGHDCHGLDYDDVLASEAEYGYPDVHGGLTYAGECAESDEASGICHVPELGRPANVWWLGFDCAHSGDFAPGMAMRSRNLGYENDRDERYRDIAYVKQETADLARQLVGATVRPSRDDAA